MKVKPCVLCLAVWLSLIFPYHLKAEGETRTLRVGATVSETGKFSTEVGPFARLIRNWAKKVNQEIKNLSIQVVVYDDRSDEATVRRLYERMAVVDKVHLFFGPYSSPLTFAASTVSENHHLPMIAICANSPKIYSRGYRWIVCVIDEAPRYSHRYWEMIKAQLQAKTVSFIVEDTLHPVGVYEGAEHLARQMGLGILSPYRFPPEAHDFTPAIAELRQKNPDIIFVSANIPMAINFMKQARELNLNPREFHVIHHSGVFQKALGAGAEWVTGQTYWLPGLKGMEPKWPVSLLQNAGFPLEDYPWAPAYMMAFQVAEAALRKAESWEPERLIQIIKALKVETLGGLVQFRENGVGSINTFPSQIQQGRYQIIWPPEVATGRYVYPRPTWSKR